MQEDIQRYCSNAKFIMRALQFIKQFMLVLYWAAQFTAIIGQMSSPVIAYIR